MRVLFGKTAFIKRVICEQHLRIVEGFVWTWSMWRYFSSLKNKRCLLRGFVTIGIDLRYTVIVARMSHWKWRETKQQSSRARSGHQISCCLLSLHFLCDILATITVLNLKRKFKPNIFLLNCHPVPQCELVVLAAAEPSEAVSAVVKVTPDHHDGRRLPADRVVRHRDERLVGFDRN